MSRGDFPRARPRFAHSGCRSPLEEVDGPVVHPAAPDGHDPGRAVYRPSAAAFLQPVDDDGPAAALDDSAATGNATPAVFVVAHPVEVRTAVAHELRNCGAAPAIRCELRDGQDRVSSPDQVLEPVERGLPPRAVRNHLFHGVLKPLEHREDVEHEGRPQTREDLSHRTLDPLRPVGQDHDLFAVESAATPRLAPEAGRERRHPAARGLRAVDCGGLRDAARDGPDPSLPVARDLADAQELRLPRFRRAVGLPARPALKFRPAHRNPRAVGRDDRQHRRLRRLGHVLPLELDDLGAERPRHTVEAGTADPHAGQLTDQP